MKKEAKNESKQVLAILIGTARHRLLLQSWSTPVPKEWPRVGKNKYVSRDPARLGHPCSKKNGGSKKPNPGGRCGLAGAATEESLGLA